MTMTTRKPKQQKALWYRQRYGDKPKAKPVRRIRPVSKIRSKRLRTYALQAALWKAGRLCECQGVKANGKAICSNRPHLCEEVHHRNGRVGDLLLATDTWVAVCSRAHRFVHDNPAEAKRLGLIGEGPWNHQPREVAA